MTFLLNKKIHQYFGDIFFAFSYFSIKIKTSIKHSLFKITVARKEIFMNKLRMTLKIYFSVNKFIFNHFYLEFMTHKKPSFDDKNKYLFVQNHLSPISMNV